MTYLNPWTDARIESLKALAANGLSASQIAGELGGVSRNAVLGKLHRLNVPLKLKPGQHFERVAKPKPRRAFGGATVVAAGGTEAIELPADQSPDACVLLDLTDESCRWPLGEPSHDMLYCGAAKLEGYPYCRRHCRLAFRR